MSTITNWILKLGVFSRLLHLDRKTDELLLSQSEVRETLNNRLENVTRATMNGETEWFLRLVKKDPTCVLNVVKECDADDES